MTKRNFHFSLYTILAILWMAGCGDNVAFDGELTTTLDNSLISNEFAAIRNMVDLEATLETAVNKSSIYCPNADVVVSSLAGNTTMTLNFQNGSACLDGRLRTGKLICSFDGKWGAIGTTVTIIPDGYSVDGWAIDFTKTIEKLPRNTKGNLEYHVLVTDAVMINTFGSIHWSSDYIAEWVAGEDTPFVVTDNEYMIDGSSAGTARSNVDFEAFTSTPLRVKMDCAHALSGVITITPEFYDQKTLDYGQGLCDNQVVLRSGEYEQVITLP